MNNHKHARGPGFNSQLAPFNFFGYYVYSMFPICSYNLLDVTTRIKSPLFFYYRIYRSNRHRCLNPSVGFTLLRVSEKVPQPKNNLVSGLVKVLSTSVIYAAQ